MASLPAVLPFVVVYAGLAVVGALMAIAQRMWPARDVPPVFDRSRTNDFAWWLFSPLVTGTFTRVMTLGAVLLAAQGLGYGLDAGTFVRALRAHLPWQPWTHPRALQWFECLLVADLLGYWSHRLRHTRWLWPFHAIHHSPERVDGLSAARMHPVDDALDNVPVGIALTLLAGDEVFQLLGATLMVHTVFTHAALDCDLGPLRYVLVSPTVHRWHHERARAIPGCNFAGMFALWDVVFGTFWCPKDARPERFGTPDARVPEHLLGQLAHPFRVLARWML